MSIISNNIILKELNLRNEKTIAKAFWIFSFAILTAIGAQIEIPHQPVPFTMQTFFVFMSGALLGKRSGAASMILYLILGSLGLPVFSSGAFGLLKIFGPTGGYLLAFPIAAYIIGYLIEIRKEYWWIVFLMFVGSFIIFSIGIIQLNFVYFHDWNRSFQAGVLIFSLWDIVKIIGASAVTYYYYRKF